MPNFISTDAARDLLNQCKRISVIGVSGAGKSTLSQELSRQLGLPHLPLDREVLWNPGWELRAPEERAHRHAALIKQPKWIIDGTSVSGWGQRLPRTDLVIWMRPPRLRALWQMAGRVARNYGKTRPDMAEGCPEKLPDWEFLQYIWTFEQQKTPKILPALNSYGPDVPVVILKHRRDGHALLRAPHRNRSPE